MNVQNFNKLVEVHGAKLYRLAYRVTKDSHTAEDVVQDVFKSIWKRNSQFVPQYEGDDGGGWLVKIVYRRIADMCKLKKFPATREDLEVGVLDRPHDLGFSDEIQNALDQLQPEFKETLLLIAIMEWTHKEVADYMKVPLGTVLSRVGRARNKMRDMLGVSHAEESIRFSDGDGRRRKCATHPVARPLAEVSVG